MTGDDLPRLLALAADDLSHRGYPPAGIVRRGARELLTLAERVAALEAELARHRRQAAEGDGCPVCGAEVPQPARGRRRVYCSDRCRKARARRKSRNAMVGP